MSSGLVELRLGPSAKNSLSWSADGEIAIAAGEDVYLLLPNYSDDAGSKPWNELRFQANNFTDDEWPPIVTPSSTDGLYIGREQRLPEVISLDWSPPGLARHRRCALAVLTTNGILSLWLSGPEPVFASGWTRSLVINLLLSKQEETNSAGINVLAYSWNRWPGESACRLAVLTEHQIHILEIGKSQTGLLERTIAMHKLATPSPQPSFAETIEFGQHGPHLAWYKTSADATIKGDSQQVFVLILQRGRLTTFEVAAKDQEPADSHLQAIHRDIKCHGPLHIEKDLMYFFFREELRTLDLKVLLTGSTNNKAPSHKTVATLDGWDSADSIVAFGDQLTNGRLAIMQPLSALSFLPFRVTKKGNKYENLVSVKKEANSRFKKRYQEIASEFSAEHGLNGKVRLKMAGLATHGRGNSYLATLVSVWSSEHIVYHIKANDKAFLVISHASIEDSSGSQEGDLQLPWQIRRENESGKSPRSRVLDVLKEIDLDAVDGQKIILAQLCISILLKDQESTDQAIRLLGRIDGGSWSGKVTSSVDVSHKEPAELQETVKTVLQLSEAYDSQMVETCTIPGCSELVLFEGENYIDGGRCLAKDHEFARCSLTGLAIQQPYISKNCEGCKRIFLDEEKLDQDAFLCKAVLSNFARCPYCNGRFAG